MSRNLRSFSDDELTGFTDQLGKIIDMVEQLGEVDTEGVPFTSNVLETINVMREDVADEGWSRDELMKMFRKAKMDSSRFRLSLTTERLVHNGKIIR